MPSIPGASISSEGTTTVPELFGEAQSLLAKGKTAEAENVYLRIVAAEPNNPPGYIGVGVCRLLQKDHDGAERRYRQALELDGQSASALIGLAAVASSRHQHEAAVGFYERALVIEERTAEAHLGIGDCHYALLSDERALHHYERFLELAPTSSQASRVSDQVAKLRARLRPTP